MVWDVLEFGSFGFVAVTARSLVHGSSTWWGRIGVARGATVLTGHVAMPCRHTCGAHLAVDPQVGTVACACTCYGPLGLMDRRVGMACQYVIGGADGQTGLHVVPLGQWVPKLAWLASDCNEFDPVYGYTFRDACGSHSVGGLPRWHGPTRLVGSQVGMAASACKTFCLRL